MNPKFIVADNDAAVGELIRAILSPMGCEVEYHENGEDLLHVLAEDGAAASYDAVFIEESLLRELDPVVLESVRQLPGGGKLPLIMLTAPGKGVGWAGASAACHEIQKPFTRDHLIYALDLLFAEEMNKSGRSRRVYEVPLPDKEELMRIESPNGRNT